ncbi:MOSC domain-containing protein [Paenibacillus agilis]|uniref:MOSC domain-containing protein n=1 Tax=Paenibacillus agilis TaxID=3020863 RepID=A0A559IWI5_9BACL|nr:MOSC domain-containing protein [Paenibacillus agilis]TVX91995.1 MOSC domain-containing protein [Paenibacillus agilis]
MHVELVGLQVGLPSESLTHNGKPVLSGMMKFPVDHTIALRTLGFEGDGQADLRYHGGPEKAVCVYPIEHYTYWQQQWDFDLPISAFGENVTTRGLIEDDVHIGDIYRIGTARVQVTQPRQPCFKLAARYNMANIPIWMQETGYTGYYWRVLEEGIVSPDDQIELIHMDEQRLSIRFANEVMHQKLHGEEGIRALLSNKGLSTNWRATFTKRLEGIETDTSKRIEGN